MAKAARIAQQGSEMHFPVLLGDQCVKHVGQYRKKRICGQSRDGAHHLFYRCRRSLWCKARFLSIEARIGHEAEEHFPDDDPVKGYR